MDVFVNELSLHGQFESSDTFLNSLKEIMNCRRVTETNAHVIYCLRSIIQRPTVANLTFRQIIQRIGDRNLTRSVTSTVGRRYHGS